MSKQDQDAVVPVPRDRACFVLPREVIIHKLKIYTLAISIS